MSRRPTPVRRWDQVVEPFEAVLVIGSGRHAGELVQLPRAKTLLLGRDEQADIQLLDADVSARHALLGFEAGEDRHWIADAGSTNGTRVNGVDLRERQALEIGDRIQLGPTVTLRFGARGDPEIVHAGLAERSTLRDATTGLYNRRYLEERLQAELAYTRRHRRWLALLLIGVGPVDDFGTDDIEAAVEAVLAHWARLLTHVVRAEDVIVRYGVDRLAVLCRDLVVDGVTSLACRIHAALSDAIVEHAGRALAIPVVVGGCAACSEDAVWLRTRAEHALDEAWAATDGPIHIA
jgi:diguanylate cyclase (GGDEF)-like protein